MEDSKLTELLVVWLGAVFAVAVFRARRKTAGAGLVLAYLINLWLIHWVASLIYLVPGYVNNDPHLVELGFEQSVYGIVAFAFGSLAFTPFLMSFGLLPRASGIHDPDRNLPKAYIAFGVVSYLLMSSALGRAPTAQAIISTGQELVVVGLSLACWQAWKEHHTGKLIAWLAISLLMPFATIVTRGFIGYGAVAAFSVLVFVSIIVRSRLTVLVVGLVLGYVGLSVYVSYMRDRGEIREVVWGGQPLKDRMERVLTTMSTFEWFDPSNRDHLVRVDNRMNQSFLVGAAVDRLSEVGGYASGETLWEAVLALVPRALWPEKPVTAGSGNVVSQYTGIQFTPGTSIGIGQVMEFYINFGTLGVILGFLAMGVIVTVLDVQAAERLAVGDLHGFVLWYLPGISFLQVGGSLMEVTSSAAASLVVALLANKYLDRLQTKQAPKSDLSPSSHRLLSPLRNA